MRNTLTDVQTDEKIARTFHRTRSRSIYGERREGIYFSLDGEDKSACAGKSISWPAARPARDRTSRYAFYNIFPSQFPFAIDDESPRFSTVYRERERKIHFHEHECKIF